MIKFIRPDRGGVTLILGKTRAYTPGRLVYLFTYYVGELLSLVRFYPHVPLPVH
jgi:hypothetical protein